jgi:hypothetical protein
MTSRVFDNGAGATLLQTANQTTLSAALVTTTAVKSSGYGFQTSAKFLALRDLVISMRAALIAAGIGK